ncbi:MAG: peptidoglycan bridge formation glycyltransferase FemA/FemB family protein [Anaerolineae bacterium]|nr:peptidoglycan bridge formation glycyltransferase FemA/FemB family protein [Anaerolineae bacterium]
MKRVDERTTWNAAVTGLPAHHVLQSWEWGAFKERYGWQAERWLWTDGPTPQAAALVLSRPLWRLPLRMVYVPKGPLFDAADTACFEQVLAGLERLARERHALQIKIDPDVPADSPAGAAAVACLKRRGWLPSAQQIQFRNTLTLDLTPGPDDLLAGMKPKWRYNIRLADRRGVTVRRGGLDDLPLLYDLYRETGRRDRFVIRTEAYYRDAWGAFIAAGLAQPFIAEFDGEPLAMILLFRFGRTAWYMYGASRSTHRDLMPNHRLQWEAIRWAQAQGCAVYDMWGAPDTLDESDPLWGVYRFKEGFGAAFVEHIGAYDYPASRLGHALYTRVAPRVLALMHWRHWRREQRQAAPGEALS